MRVFGKGSYPKNGTLAIVGERNRVVRHVAAKDFCIKETEPSLLGVEPDTGVARASKHITQNSEELAGCVARQRS